MKQKYASFIASAILISSSFSIYGYAGKVYKWTDKNGVIHYGDKRPSGTQTETLRVEPHSSSARTSPQDQLKVLEEQQERTRMAENELEKEAQAKKQTQARCEQAKSNLFTIENHPRTRIKENGELRYMTPKEVTTKKDEMSKIIEEACGKN
jgi:ABC-type phosphate transport system auxiliary subunit